jgi:hypothetical protein
MGKHHKNTGKPPEQTSGAAKTIRAIGTASPPPGSKGKPRGVVHKFGKDGRSRDVHEAKALAQTYKWWPLVVNKRGTPYSDAAHWFWILSKPYIHGE